MKASIQSTKEKFEALNKKFDVTTKKLTAENHELWQELEEEKNRRQVAESRIGAIREKMVNTNVLLLTGSNND